MIALRLFTYLPRICCPNCPKGRRYSFDFRRLLRETSSMSNPFVFDEPCLDGPEGHKSIFECFRSLHTTGERGCSVKLSSNGQDRSKSSYYLSQSMLGFVVIDLRSCHGGPTDSPQKPPHWLNCLRYAAPYIEHHGSERHF
jgi:hypothetical protein